jgi:hypothetical protein
MPVETGSGLKEAAQVSIVSKPGRERAGLLGQLPRQLRSAAPLDEDIWFLDTSEARILKFIHKNTSLWQDVSTYGIWHGVGGLCSANTLWNNCRNTH